MKISKTMKTRSKIALVAAAAAFLSACERGGEDFRAERASRLYQTAMAEYRAGRVNEAIAGFEKVVRKDPLNSSARFQLACLQQDVRRDYLRAYCNLREYLVQAHGSDKAGMAEDRLKMCERELARVLAEKYALIDKAGIDRLVEPLKAELEKKEKRIGELEKSLAESESKARSLRLERDRLVENVKSTGAGESFAKPSLKGVRELLDEGDEELSGVTPVDDVDEIKAEGEDEKELASSLLPAQRKSPGTESADRRVSAPSRPERYVVRDGDTLYKIAVRFYGRTSAWREIRDANKTVISTDGRVKSGDEIVLP